MGEQVAAGFPWGISSVGRAPALQAGGHEFESRYLHESVLKAQSMDWGRKQVYLRFRSQVRECICKMHVNEEISDFRVPRSFQSCFYNTCTLKTTY